MAAKLKPKTWPAGHGPNDFKCFGPPATKDGEFQGTKIVDMGCFMQEAVDSNKYYHAAVVQSTKDKNWYVYVEYARVGAANPAFQFIPCSSQAGAESEYVKACEKKNIKRGVWENHKTLGRRLVPKPKRSGGVEDLYIVRPQATRSTGLPDAKTITTDEGLDLAKKKPEPKKKGKRKKVECDQPTLALMRDLGQATVKYTKSSIQGSALPTQTAIDQGRAILQEALRRVASVGDNVDQQVKDNELKQLTRDMYGIIPKVKDRGAALETWILSKDNIFGWQQDLDAFESALYVADLGSLETESPYGDLPLKMEHLGSRTDLGLFIYDWMPKATLNRHGWVGRMNIKNAWKVDRHGDDAKLRKEQERIAKDRWRSSERPLHQPRSRPDLTEEERKLYLKSGTHLFFHGTRSVNVSGILRESLRLPKQLVGVVITAAMFGPGLYWADDWKKSAGYTSLRGSVWSSGSGGVRGRGAFMFVTDVVLGCPYVANGPSGYTRPPRGHHSVMGKAGHSGVMNNEFITYERETHKLRYLVEFEA